MESRRKNFTEIETEAFLLCLEKFKDVIENKKTDAVTNQGKKMAWGKLTEMFNSFPGVIKRDAKQLITFYKNIKRRGNKNRADTRIKIFGTGGGPKENVPPNPVEERLVAMGAVKVPLVNPYDSDAAYHKATSSDPKDAEIENDQEESHEVVEVLYNKDATAEYPGNVEEVLYDDMEEDVEDIPLSYMSASSALNTNIDTPSSSQVEESCSSPAKKKPESAFTPRNKKKFPTFTPCKRYKLKRNARLLPPAPVSASAKVADSMIENSEIKKKILLEQQEFEKEKLRIEKEKLSMKKEKHILEIKILNEQLKMYELVNEKMLRGEMPICIHK